MVFSKTGTNDAQFNMGMMKVSQQFQVSSKSLQILVKLIFLARQLPPYVNIMATHTRLSLYSKLINHPSASLPIKRLFRTAGLSCALKVMRTAVQGETELRSMPNNLAIMISFAACFAFQLSPVSDGPAYDLAPSVTNLIMETADVLNRIGTQPAHRNGTPALFARYLQEIVVTASKSAFNTSPSGQNAGTHAKVSGMSVPGQRQDMSEETTGHPSIFSQGSLPFSQMSYEEINETVNNAGTGIHGIWDNLEWYPSVDFNLMGWQDLEM